MLFAVLLLLLLPAPSAGEASVADDGGAGFDPAERYRACDPGDAVRLEFLERRIRDNAPYARWWSRAWLGVYVGGMAFEGVRAGLTDARERRAAAIANASKSTIGLARALLSPPTAMGDVDAFDAPVEDAGHCTERLEAAEARLRQSAEEARHERWGWIPHLANFALNAGAAVTVAELYDYDAAYARGALGFAVGEIRLWSFPWHAESDWADYEDRFGEARSAAPETTWMLEATPNGARVVVRF